MRKPVFRFPTTSHTNRAVQPHKMARGLKFRIKEVEGLYYLCSANKGADQLRGSACFADTAKLFCVFVFAYAKSRFSRDMAQLKWNYVHFSRQTNAICIMFYIFPFYSIPHIHMAPYHMVISRPNLRFTENSVNASPYRDN